MLDTISDIMRKNGYEDGSYRLVQQSYSNIFAGSNQRYESTGSEDQMKVYESPGVALSNATVNYSRRVMVPAITKMGQDAVAAASNKSIQFMNLTNALAGHELSSTYTKYTFKHENRVPDPATAEWVVPLNSNYMAGAIGTHRQQESYHPNRYGQEAYGTCLAATLKTAQREMVCVGQPNKGPNLIRTNPLGAKVALHDQVNAATAAKIPSAAVITGVQQLGDRPEILTHVATPPKMGNGSQITDFEYSTDGGNSWSKVDRECICVLLKHFAAAQAANQISMPTAASWTIKSQSVSSNPALKIGETYKVMVRAVNGVGVGEASNTGRVTLEGGRVPPEQSSVMSVS